jgi:hypothetical protein
MNKAVLPLLVLLVLLAPLAARCADNAVPSGPSLGDEKLTMHLAETPSDVIQTLADIADRQVYLNSPLPAARQEGAHKANTPVRFDLDNASFVLENVPVP